METKSMFWFTLIILVSVWFISGITFASTPASECLNTLNQKFQGRFSYPEQAYKQAIQGDVIVIFSVSDEGKIIIKDIRSTDAELGKYIREVMSTVQCPELNNASIYDFKIIFHFKLI